MIIWDTHASGIGTEDVACDSEVLSLTVQDGDRKTPRLVYRVREGFLALLYKIVIICVSS